ARNAEDPLVGPLAYDPWGSGTGVVFNRTGRGLLWDTVRHRRREPTLSPPGRTAVRAVAFVERGRRLVTCDIHESRRVWAAATGQPACGPSLETGGSVSTLAISPDGRTLVTGGDDGRVVQHDLARGLIVGPTLPHGAPVGKVAFLGDGRRILVATRD